MATMPTEEDLGEEGDSLQEKREDPATMAKAPMTMRRVPVLLSRCTPPMIRGKIARGYFLLPIHAQDLFLQGPRRMLLHWRPTGLGTGRPSTAGLSESATNLEVAARPRPR